MIRRWSSIKLISYDINSLVGFNAVKRLKLFRKSVKFRKFHVGLTKFKRRHLRKLRHKATWAVYYNVFKYWTDALRISRQYARFQYYYRIFVNNSVVVDTTKLTRRRNRVYFTQDQWVTATITRCLFLTLGGDNNTQVLKSHRFSRHSVAFFPSEEITDTVCTMSSLSFFDKQFFVKNFESEIDLNDIFLNDLTFQDTLLTYHIEYYNILKTLQLHVMLNLNINVF